MEENLSTGQKINISTSNVHTLTDTLSQKFVKKDKNLNEIVNFTSYAYSRLGNNCKANNDNFYCNGSYMKHFKYEDFKKSDISENEMGIYAVCCDETENDEGCRIAFKCLSEFQDRFNRCGSIGKVKKLLKWYLNEVYRRIMEDEFKNEKQYCISLSVAVFFQNTVVYSSYGNSVIVSYNKKKKVRLLKNMPDNFIGIGALNAKVYTDYYTENSKFAFCTKGIMTKMSMDDLIVAGECDEAKDIAVDLVNSAMGMGTQKNATCLTVKTHSPNKLKLLSVIVMAICSAVICFDIAVLIRVLTG